GFPSAIPIGSSSMRPGRVDSHSIPASPGQVPTAHDIVWLPRMRMVRPEALTSLADTAESEVLTYSSTIRPGAGGASPGLHPPKTMPIVTHKQLVHKVPSFVLTSGPPRVSVRRIGAAIVVVGAFLADGVSHRPYRRGHDG